MNVAPTRPNGFIEAPKDEGEAIAMQRDSAIATTLLPFAEERYQKTLRAKVNQMTHALDTGTLSEKDAWLAWAEVAAAFRLVRELRSGGKLLDTNPMGQIRSKL